MLKFAAIAMVGALSAVGAAKAVVSLDDLRHPELRAPTAASATLGGSDGAAQLTKGADGHFWAEAAVDGKAVRSCLILAIEVDGQSVTTLEGVGKAGPTALQKAFIQHNVFQCGFCAPGVVLSASALLVEKPQPTEHEVREALAGNLCRCTGYEPIVDAVMAVAKKNRRKKSVSRRARS